MCSGMELVSFAKDVLQDVAERTASYRIGQTALRQLDRALWVVEKSARWAVPPPLEQDEAQPELVRPLPWVFFLAMLIALRVSREALSLLNLALGKPPLRSADVVTYIQGKRRYLCTLKYQGNRLRRARTAAQRPRQPWHAGLRALLDLALCLRPRSAAAHAHDEILVVSDGKRSRPQSDEVASNDTMERLIEQMMTDLDAESDADSSYTLTNPKSNETIDSGSENETIVDRSKEPATPSEGVQTEAESKDLETESNDPDTENKDPNAENKDMSSENKNLNAENKDPDTENKDPNAENKDPNAENKDPNAENKDPNAENKDSTAENKDPNAENKDPNAENKDPNAENKDPNAENKDLGAESKEQEVEAPVTSPSEDEVNASTPEKYSTPEKGSPVSETKESVTDPLPEEAEPISAKELTMQFLQNEITSQCARKSPKKIANGRIKRDLSKRKGSNTERRD